MPKYKYLGTNSKNKAVKGKLSAKSENEAYKLLKEDGITAYNINILKESNKNKYKLKAPQLCEFSRQVGTMLGSGVSIMKTMSMLRDSEVNKKVKKVYEELCNTINRGNTLSTAMETCDGAFPEMMINIFKSGEESGKLDRSAFKMADYYDRNHKLNTKVKNAMTYPLVLFVVTIIVVIIVFTVILPQFFDLFEGIEIPLITRIMIGVSHALRDYGILIGLVFFLLGVMSVRLYKVDKVRMAIDRKKVKMKKIGKLLSIIYTARFSRTLSSLYSSGLVLLDAVNFSAKVTGNRYIESQFPEMISKIKAGNPLSFAIESVEGFDPKLTAVIYIGEETGKLDDMLNSIADSFDHDADAATTRLLTLIEPIMIVSMAVIVGGIMLSVMLPILTMYNNIG